MSYDITATPLLPERNRRMSVEDSTAKLVFTIRNTIDKLTDLWDKVHMEKDSREKRIDFALDHVYDLLNQIISSEEEMIKNVEMDIEARRKNLNKIRQSFGIEEFDESPYPKGSIALLKALNKDFSALESRKEKLLQTQTEIYEKLLELSRRIEAPIEPILGVCDTILSAPKIQEIKDTLERFEGILNERIGQIDQLQAESKKIYENLSTSSNISLEELKILNTNFHSSNIPLNEELVEKCINLNEKLKNEYDIWIEQVAFRYDELLIKLDEISHKCFRADGAHIYPSNFDPTNLGERDLQKLEEDVKKLEEKYERGRPVFDKLNEWMSLWKEKLNAEQRVCRTSFYNQRGGNLQASLKRQKTIASKVPKSFDELRLIVAEYVEKYGMSDILVDGMCPDKYAEFVMEEYERDREVQRSQKVLQKQPNSENRSRFKTTATLRSRMPTVAKTVNRPPLPRAHRPLIPIENQQQQPKSASRKRSLSCGEVSIISPLRTPILHGPKTSSPKNFPHNNMYPSTHGTLSTISGSTTSGYAGTGTVSSSGYGQTFSKTPTKVPKLIVGASNGGTPKAAPPPRPWY